MPANPEIPDYAVNLPPSLIAQAMLVNATPDNPVYGQRIANVTGLTTSAAYKLLDGMRSAGLAEGIGHFRRSPTGTAANAHIGTGLLTARLEDDAHLFR